MISTPMNVIAMTEAATQIAHAAVATRAQSRLSGTASAVSTRGPDPGPASRRAASNRRERRNRASAVTAAAKDPAITSNVTTNAVTIHNTFISALQTSLVPRCSLLSTRTTLFRPTPVLYRPENGFCCTDPQNFLIGADAFPGR